MELILEKKCAKCKKSLPLENFHNSGGGKFGKHCYCKQCLLKSHRDYSSKEKIVASLHFKHSHKWKDTKSKKDKGCLSKEEIEIILERQKLKCSITGYKFKNVQRNILFPSIDRIDSSKPYSLENCHIILTGLNFAKRDYPTEDFETFIEVIKGNISLK